ncbi:MAG: hypothetical protein HN691_01865 [Bacteroidetes bacterium]|jgi:hypothetical protein|nr:hypothetical protein [Bacteroidota bacterium]
MKEIQYQPGNTSFDPEIKYFLDEEIVSLFLKYHEFQKKKIGLDSEYRQEQKIIDNRLEQLNEDYDILTEIIKSGNYRTYNNKKLELEERKVGKSVAKIFIFVLIILLSLIGWKFSISIGFKYFPQETNARVMNINVLKNEQNNHILMIGKEIEYEYLIKGKKYLGSQVFLKDENNDYKEADTIKIEYISFNRKKSKIKTYANRVDSSTIVK